MTRPPGKHAAILVLGMHRSGSSALARLLNVLGAALPEQLLGPGHGNPLGHWEALRLVDLNDEILASIGRSWTDPRPIPRRWFRSQAAYKFQERLGEVIASVYGDASLILIKDPRICRLVPLYLDVLDSGGIDPLVVIPLRHPAEAIRSIQERDQLDPLILELVWLRSLLEAEEATRGCARVWTSFDRLLDDWETAARSIADGLKIVWPNALEGVAAEAPNLLRPRHRHYKVTTDPAPSPIGPLTLRVWQAAQFCLEGNETAGRAIFDEVRAAVTEVDRLSLPQQEELDRRVGVSETGRQQANARCEQLNQELQERATQLSQLEAKLADRAQAQAQLSQQVQECRAQIAKLEAKLADRAQAQAQLSEQVQECRARIARLRGQIDSIQASVCWRITWPIRWLHKQVNRFRGCG